MIGAEVAEVVEVDVGAEEDEVDDEVADGNAKEPNVGTVDDVVDGAELEVVVLEEAAGNENAVEREEVAGTVVVVVVLR